MSNLTKTPHIKQEKSSSLNPKRQWGCIHVTSRIRYVIFSGDLDSSLETSLLLLETSGGETEHSNQQEPRPIDDTEVQSFSSNATVLDSTNDAEVIAMDISGLKERLASTDLTQLGSHDLVEVHEHLNSMMASVVLALKAKCRTSPKRAGNRK